MKIEKINNLWLPSEDAQIEQWRDSEYPYMQDKCLKRLLIHCKVNNIKFKTVLDIGAWCGTWSLAMQKYAENIFCYEPNKTHFACLEKNLAPFSNVSLYNCAIGNEEGFVKLTEEIATQKLIPSNESYESRFNTKIILYNKILNKLKFKNQKKILVIGNLFSDILSAKSLNMKYVMIKGSFNFDNSQNYECNKITELQEIYKFI